MKAPKGNTYFDMENPYKRPQKGLHIIAISTIP